MSERYFRKINNMREKINNMVTVEFLKRFVAIETAVGITFVAGGLYYQSNKVGKLTKISGSENKIINGLSFSDQDSQEDITKKSKEALKEILDKKSYSKDPQIVDLLNQTLERYIENYYKYPNYYYPNSYRYDEETGRLSEVTELEKDIQKFLKSVALTDDIILVSKDPKSEYYDEDNINLLEDEEAAGLSFYETRKIIVLIDSEDRWYILGHELEHRVTQYARFPEDVKGIFEDEEINKLYKSNWNEFGKIFVEGKATRVGNRQLLNPNNDLNKDTMEFTDGDDAYAEFKTESVYGFYYTMFKDYEYLLGNDFIEEWMTDSKYDKNVIQEMKNRVDQKYGEGAFEKIFKYTLLMAENQKTHKILKSLEKQLSEDDYNSLKKTIEENDKENFEIILEGIKVNYKNQFKKILKRHNANDLTFDSVMKAETSNVDAMHFQKEMLELMQKDINKLNGKSNEEIIHALENFKTYYVRTMIDLKNQDKEDSTSEKELEEEFENRLSEIKNALRSALIENKVKFGGYEFGKNESSDQIIFDIYFDNPNIGMLENGGIQVQQVVANKILVLNEDGSEETKELTQDEAKTISFIYLTNAEGEGIASKILVDGCEIEKMNFSVEKAHGICLAFAEFLENQNFDFENEADRLRAEMWIDVISRSSSKIARYIEREIDMCFFVDIAIDSDFSTDRRNKKINLDKEREKLNNVIENIREAENIAMLNPSDLSAELSRFSTYYKSAAGVHAKDNGAEHLANKE